MIVFTLDAADEEARTMAMSRGDKPVVRKVDDSADESTASSQPTLRSLNGMRSSYHQHLSLMDVSPTDELRMFLAEYCELRNRDIAFVLSQLSASGVTSIEALSGRAPAEIRMEVRTFRRSDRADRGGSLKQSQPRPVTIISLDSWCQGRYRDEEGAQQAGDKLTGHDDVNTYFSRLLSGKAIDRYRQRLLDRRTLSWPEDRALRMMVLKPKSTARQADPAKAWHKRQVILTEGMFIYTTWGLMKLAQRGGGGAGGSRTDDDTQDTLTCCGRSCEVRSPMLVPDSRVVLPSRCILKSGIESLETRYQLRGRLRIAKEATVRDVAEQDNPRLGVCNDEFGGFGQGLRVYGIDFTPDPCGSTQGAGAGAEAGGAPNGGRTFRLYCATQADREWLREAIEINVRYVQLRGRPSSESEYVTRSGFMGQFWGACKGEDIRGEQRPSVLRRERQRQLEQAAMAGHGAGHGERELELASDDDEYVYYDDHDSDGDSEYEWVSE